MKTIAYCATCGRKLIGESLNRIGDNFYCHSDYSKQMERSVNYRVVRNTQKTKELLSDFENLLETDLTNWNLINCTESSNIITS